jgi:hypothetical protein
VLSQLECRGATYARCRAGGRVKTNSEHVTIPMVRWSNGPAGHLILRRGEKKRPSRLVLAMKVQLSKGPDSQRADGPLIKAPLNPNELSTNGPEDQRVCGPSPFLPLDQRILLLERQEFSEPDARGATKPNSTARYKGGSKYRYANPDTTAIFGERPRPAHL